MRRIFELALACVVVMTAASVHARTGTGDPAAVFRDRPVNPESDIDLVLHGQLRLRAMGALGLDLSRAPSPTTGQPLFGAGAQGALDARIRITPSLFIGDDVRIFGDLDLAAGSLGATPDGVPWAFRSDSERTAALSLFDVRALGVDWMLPIGVLSVGRMPSHFGLGIAANDGGSLDDDGGDRGDRIALVVPAWGVLFASAFDVGPGPLHSAFGPTTRALSLGEQAVSVAVMRWHAPWEVELLRKAGRVVVDGGIVGSFEWANKDIVPPWVGMEDAFVGRDPLAVRRDARLLVGDAWGRLVWDRLRIEGEAWASDLAFDNPSPIVGVEVRRTIVGNPWAATLIGEWRLLDDATDRGWLVQLEGGAASADPAAGFTAVETTAFASAVPGDVFGPQVDLKAGGDVRLDGGRIHPLHRVDLILWRTLLGGVSEAAYGRAHLEGSPLSFLRLDASAIYSHALSIDSTPGGAGPLGVEVDVGAEATWGGASVRVDAGALAPLGGLGVRGGQALSSGQLVLVRVGDVF